MLIGKHLIAGNWVAGETTFENTPVEGDADVFATGSAEHVNAAVEAAEEAFWSFGYSSRASRAKFLRAIADQIESRGDEITAIGTKETGLPAARLNGERGRTVGQLKLFADHIEAGEYLDRRHDEALPDRQPLPRADLKMVQRPIGPVAVFGASNFPLAFSTAGGDTASALAAGCPVVVKGHSAHPGVGDIVAQAILAAIKQCDIHPGVFSQIQGGNRAVGSALVQHPLIKAVGFTGSLGGGRALFDLCAGRPEPIPFFGELGSVNPVFVLDHALKNRGSDIAAGWAGSLTMGAGQFCTNPGIVVVQSGAEAEAFIKTAIEKLSEIGPQVMLTDGIASAYHAGAAAMADAATSLLSPNCSGRSAEPVLLRATADEFLAKKGLMHEVFGPLGLIVTVKDEQERLSIARALEGQLTCTLLMDDEDTKSGQALVPVLERKAGRLLVNGFPTGVEVSDTMVHGGPYPASTNFGATSVGTLAIRRFLRPVCYQNMPESLLPSDLT
ncbi:MULTISPECIES: aldehyde dehydrogenase (NADP(+)) [Roseibium]|uniref:aldehyde dehydrogenase (NADP(+)) n=1 Tax=Roseibium TaxID=150830 RepID=UPI00326747AF